MKIADLEKIVSESSTSPALSVVQSEQKFNWRSGLGTYINTISDVQTKTKYTRHNSEYNIHALNQADLINLSAECLTYEVYGELNQGHNCVDITLETGDENSIDGKPGNGISDKYTLQDSVYMDTLEGNVSLGGYELISSNKLCSFSKGDKNNESKSLLALFINRKWNDTLIVRYTEKKSEGGVVEQELYFSEGERDMSRLDTRKNTGLIEILKRIDFMHEHRLKQISSHFIGYSDELLNQIGLK